MPYIRKTSRKLCQHIITFPQLDEANWKVTCEMAALGLWIDALCKVNVWLVPASFKCYGWHQGDIHIPALSGAQLYDLICGHHTRLTDVLRHEWAHAIADHCSKLMLSAKFERTFGGSYNQITPVADYDPERHLTPYAATMPCEDFAETFHYFLATLFNARPANALENHNPPSRRAIIIRSAPRHNITSHRPVSCTPTHF